MSSWAGERPRQGESWAPVFAVFLHPGCEQLLRRLDRDVRIRIALYPHARHRLEESDEGFRVRGAERTADGPTREFCVIDGQLDAVVTIELLHDVLDGVVLEDQPAVRPGERAVTVDLAHRLRRPRSIDRELLTGGAGDRGGCGHCSL